MGADLRDRADFDDADRGFVATIHPMAVTAPDGRVVFEMDGWGFLEGDCPDTAHPGLWRQGQLNARHGLYEVTPRIYQVRGFDVSNMTLVEGDRGVIVIDPLMSVETGAAALALYRAHRGERPVTAVIYTHSHADHFGGVLGVVGADTDVPIVAPEHFLEHAVEENVFAGPAMWRRARYYGGADLPRGPGGTLGMGLGPTGSTGSVSLLVPTLDITHTGQEEVLDGVRIVLQSTPGTEAPAEMNFYFPDERALCMAENATHNQHNLLTLRGALVRDPRIWSRYLDEAIELFARDSDVAFASHHWPTWGTERIVTYLTQQRDLYAYLHDQTLRLMNKGYVGSEIAERIELPPELEAAWHTHGFYGSTSHNVKAVYQRYLGWYDGNPAHLWPHPPEEAARRYVRAIGGLDATLDRAREFLDDGDLRFAAELASHAVFAAPERADARELLADVLERLGYGSECATWRNCFLTGALELRADHIAVLVQDPSGMAAALTVTQLFDSLSIRIDGPKAWSQRFTIDWRILDLDERYRMELSNGALTHHPLISGGAGKADVEVSLTRVQLVALLFAGVNNGVETDGDAGLLDELLGLVDPPEPNFPVVTP